jgi:hypothetical protein
MQLFVYNSTANTQVVRSLRSISRGLAGSHSTGLRLAAAVVGRRRSSTCLKTQLNSIQLNWPLVLGSMHVEKLQLS